METTPLELASFDQPPYAAKPSSSAAQHGGICLPFDEAVKTLPEFLQPENKYERDELAMFLSHVDEIHKPDGPYVSAKSVLNANSIIEAAIRAAEADSMVTWYDILDFYESVDVTCGSVATEIAIKVINGAGSHEITLSVFNILQRFSWETKAAVIARSFILTFGDNGLNLCAQSKLSSIIETPTFVNQLLEIISSIVEFERLPKLFRTSTDPTVKVARTHFIVAIYWIVRATMDTSSTQIKSISNLGDQKSSSWLPKFGTIRHYVETQLPILQKLLEDTVDMEVYKKIKEIVHKEDHSDSMEVLNALIADNDDTPNLYYGPGNKKVAHLNVLDGKYVLLLLSMVEFSNEMAIIHLLMKSEQKESIPLEMVWIPIIDHLVEHQRNDFDMLKNLVSWYSVDRPWMMKNEVIKFIREDWNFGGEPMIVALDSQGKVVNQNAIHMMLIWGMRAFPFTNTREETLWKQETWRLELLLDDMDHQDRELISQDKWVFLYGGADGEWLTRFRREVRNVAGKLGVEVEMFYVLASRDGVAWRFWRRLESMIYSMAKVGKFDVIFEEIQRVYNHNSSKVCWATLAKGSTILVLESV